MLMLLKSAQRYIDADLLFLNVLFEKLIISTFFLQNGYFDAKHFLLYYYYGGVIYAALKNYERSLYFFEVALTTPSSAISHIMLESYKKYILVSLILQGKVMRLNCITCLWLLDDNLSHLLRLRLYQSTRHKW